MRRCRFIMWRNLLLVITAFPRDCLVLGDRPQHVEDLVSVTRHGHFISESITNATHAVDGMTMKACCCRLVGNKRCKRKSKQKRYLLQGTQGNICCKSKRRCGFDSRLRTPVGSFNLQLADSSQSVNRKTCELQVPELKRQKSFGLGTLHRRRLPREARLRLQHLQHKRSQSQGVFFQLDM